MAFFVVDYHYTSDAARLEEVRTEHRGYLHGLLDEGLLRAAGRYVDVEEPAALLIFTATDADTVREVIADDPYQRAGLVREWGVTEWNPVVGEFAIEIE